MAAPPSHCQGSLGGAPQTQGKLYQLVLWNAQVESRSVPWLWRARVHLQHEPHLARTVSAMRCGPETLDSLGVDALLPHTQILPCTSVLAGAPSRHMQRSLSLLVFKLASSSRPQPTPPLQNLVSWDPRQGPCSQT